MRLVIDGQRLTARRTGVGRCLESLLAGWANTSWPIDEVVLVTREATGTGQVPESQGLTTIQVGARWPGLVWEVFGLGRVLGPGDLLFAPANLVPWTWRGPTVAILYDTLPWSAPNSFPWHVRARFNWRYRLAARRATHVIVPSASTARDVQKVHGLAPDRISIVFPGPDPRFRPLSADDPVVRAARHEVGLGEAPFFLFVGKRSRRRNVPAILAAFAAHRNHFPDHRLVFVGPDPLPEAPPGVIAAGHVGEGTLHGLLAGATALLYPSDHEGFGLPVVEAQACACPVVTLRNSALTESGGDAAYYLDRPDPADIARALHVLATDLALRTDLARGGLAHVQRFRSAEFAEGVGAILRRVADESRREPARV